MDARNRIKVLRNVMKVGVVLAVLSTSDCEVIAQELIAQPALTSIASPSQDDATIHDLTLTGNKSGWAVGDRGTIWRTNDGGNTWEFIQATPHLEQHSFESVCFLTDRVGWIAGGAVSSVGRIQAGVVLATTDGGQSWKILSNGQLPYLRKVQFFDLDNGIAVGERTAQYPAGIVTTSDGGQTWAPINSDHNATWNDAEFFNQQTGLVVGNEGAQAAIANGGLLPGSGDLGGLQAIHDIASSATGRCWMVGDGALLLTSQNRGATWSFPPSELPKKLNDFANFECVAQRNGHVWIAGTPGTVIWHSPDSGQTWEKQRTGGSAPLKTIHFSDDQHGVAAGVFGRICVTHDGGKTWVETRGKNRRLAVWALHAHTTRVPYSFLTRWSRESGYRSAVTLTTRRDLGVDSYSASENRVRFQQSVQMAGSNLATIDWRLPVTIPGLDRDETKLIEEWSKLTDQRLPEVLLGTLVAQIRTWKPDVILLDEPPSDDAVTKFIHRTLPEAVAQARDPSKFPEQLNVGLTPWNVQKVVMERAIGRRGSISQKPFEILPHLETTLDLATLQAASRMFKDAEESVAARGYEVLYTAPESHLSKASIFGDLKIRIDSEARRAVPSLRSIDLDRLIEQAKYRRTLTALSQRMIDSPEHGAQLLAQLREMLKPLTNEQAARQLTEMAMKYRNQGQWTLAEETYSELIINYPEQPQSLEAMLWLVEFSTSAEMNWQRLRAMNASNSHIQNDPAIVQANFQKSLEIIGRNATRAGFLNEIQHLQDGVESSSTALIPVLGGSPGVLNGSSAGASQHDLQLRRWHGTASKIVHDLSAAYPRLFEEDEMQFVVAALQRRRKQSRQADKIYGRYLQRLNDDDPWHVAAKGETYLLRPGALSPKPVIACRTTKTPPVLDGRLIDPCWSAAIELKLSENSKKDIFVGTDQDFGGRVDYVEPQPIVMFCRDDKYLYVSARVPKNDKVEYAATQLAGRPRDADLGKHDYLTLQFDVDRDYATYYRFDVDQRGWTRESCWDAWGYNPEWFVASVQDSTSWSIEIAIPIEELLPTPLNPQNIWALGVTRVMPGVGVQSWTSSGGEKPVPPLFGFLRFE